MRQFFCSRLLTVRNALVLSNPLFAGRLVIIGFGAVAQGVALLFRHLTLRPEQVTIITADACGEPKRRRPTG
jgi:homospermidine synthase